MFSSSTGKNRFYLLFLVFPARIDRDKQVKGLETGRSSFSQAGAKGNAVRVCVLSLFIHFFLDALNSKEVSQLECVHIGGLLSERMLTSGHLV